MTAHADVLELRCDCHRLIALAPRQAGARLRTVGPEIPLVGAAARLRCTKCGAQLELVLRPHT